MYLFKFVFTELNMYLFFFRSCRIQMPRSRPNEEKLDIQSKMDIPEWLNRFFAGKETKSNLRVEGVR